MGIYNGAVCTSKRALKKRVAQMLDHFTQYVGSAPDASPAVLCSIAHIQTDSGVWYPKGGTGAVPKALAELARSLGVEMRLNTGIRQILLGHDKTVRGVVTEEGEIIELAAVVSKAGCWAWGAATRTTMMYTTSAPKKAAGPRPVRCRDRRN